MTLYIDIIFLENIIMNYIIILTTATICKNKLRQFRFISASIIGGIYAISLYIINLNIFNNIITKFLLSICMVYISCNPRNIKILLKQLIVFYLTSFCFGGVAFYLLNSININRANTYPIKVAIYGGIIGFILINISFKVVKGKLSKTDLIYILEIGYKNKNINTKVMLDTGNLLEDPITNIPVVIIEEKEIRKLLTGEELKYIKYLAKGNYIDGVSEEIKSRCTIIPFSSIGKNNGMIIGFRPEYIKIYSEKNDILINRSIVGIYEGEISKRRTYSGLIGLNLLNIIRTGDLYEYSSNVKN